MASICTVISLSQPITMETLLFFDKFLYFLEDFRVSITIVKFSNSPNSTTADCGHPFSLTVDTTANLFSLMKLSISEIFNTHYIKSIGYREYRHDCNWRF